MECSNARACNAASQHTALCASGRRFGPRRQGRDDFVSRKDTGRPGVAFSQVSGRFFDRSGGPSFGARRAAEHRNTGPRDCRNAGPPQRSGAAHRERARARTRSFETLRERGVPKISISDVAKREHITLPHARWGNPRTGAISEGARSQIAQDIRDNPGATYDEIAQRHGVTRYSVRKVAEAQDLRHQRYRPYVKQVTPEERQRIAHYVREHPDARPIDLAIRFNRDKVTIRRALAADGAAPAPGGSGLTCRPRSRPTDRQSPAVDRATEKRDRSVRRQVCPGGRRPRDRPVALEGSGLHEFARISATGPAKGSKRRPRCHRSVLGFPDRPGRVFAEFSPKPLQ